MKSYYKKPELEAIRFSASDVILTSGDDGEVWDNITVPGKPDNFNEQESN